MKATVTKAFARMMAYQLENTPNADDLDIVVEAYTDAFSMLTEDQVARRFTLWMNNQSRWPTPADIRNMRVSDYTPTENTGQPAIGNDSRRLPLKSESVSSEEYAAEWLAKMQEKLS